MSIPSRRAAKRGFTLVEVTIAILVLATSLVTLLGLQASAMQRALRDRNKQQAILLARRIMALYESGQVEADVGERKGAIREFIRDLDEEELEDSILKEQIDRFNATVSIKYWQLPHVEEQAIKRIDLTITWNDSLETREPSPLDKVQVTYFIPNEEYDDLNDPLSSGSP